MITLHFEKNQISGLEKGLELVAKVRKFALCEDGPTVIVKQGPKLSVKAVGGIYEIGYQKKPDFYRAVSMLVGMLEQGKTEFIMEEESCLDMCGIMVDCSRNAVLTPNKAVELFTYAAMMGMNCIMLYTEDTYEVDDYEYFGYLRGRYTKEELRTLDQAALDLGLDIVPCIQTLAHLATTLRWGYANDMKDDDDVLLIDEPKTYEFIESMFKSLRSCCSSRRIHIGMDEAHGVGLGNYLKKHGYCNRFDILSRHLNKVCELAAKYDFTPMMWSDMFFRISSKTGDYYDFEAEIPADLCEKIPDNISMVYWDYYHKNREEYLTMIKGHEKLKREIIFAGGIWNWSGMGPDYDQTFRTTFPALSACREKNIRNLFATMWGDDGGEVSVFSNLLGIQLYAEYNYYKEVDMDHLKERFALCTGMNADAFLALAVDNLPKEMTEENFIALSRVVLYQDILCGLFDKNLAGFALEEEYDKMLCSLNQLEDQGDWEYLFTYYRALLTVLKRKVHMGVKIRAAYDKGDKEAQVSLAEELALLSEEYKAFHKEAYTYWHKLNKVFGYDIFELRIGGALLRIQTAERKIRDYLNGDIDKIEELEEKLLWYHSDSTKDKLVATQRYAWIASVGRG